MLTHVYKHNLHNAVRTPRHVYVPLLYSLDLFREAVCTKHTQLTDVATQLRLGRHQQQFWRWRREWRDKRWGGISKSHSILQWHSYFLSCSLSPLFLNLIHLKSSSSLSVIFSLSFSLKLIFSVPFALHFYACIHTSTLTLSLPNPLFFVCTCTLLLSISICLCVRISLSRFLHERSWFCH